jgi:GT2 family glycosyltransferase
LLPGLVQALAAQTYQVEQTVGVDTGSRDRSGAVLAELIGQDAVFGVDRSTGYGEAVEVALRHATRRRSGMTDPNLTRVDWIWLLHDDCEPAPDALEKLLRAASKDRNVVVVGPKVLDGQDRRTLCEVGVSIDRAGRRVTGIDPGEIDQGQHDHKRDVLAVGSAGMLVRRDVWDRLGGFDPSLKLFRDDVDFCWRVQAAGFRVQVATDAVLYHRELVARRRRPTDVGNARRLDRRNALYVLAVNLPLLTMLRVVGGCIVGSLIRATYFLLTKQLDLSAAYAFSVLALFAHPVRLIQGRRRRAKGLADGYTAVRLFIPPARTLSRLAEKIAGLVSNGPPQVSYGRHQATAEESEEDEQFVDQQSVVRRIVGHPGVQLFVALLVIALIAERRLLVDNPLGGGALVPAWGGAAALWQEYLAGFHAVSVGSTASAPPYLAVVAGLATLLGGQAWLAVNVLLLGCVPLAGLTAYLATRRLVTATAARVLLAASYALLPVATGAVAAGRLGTAVAFILLPLAALNAGRMLTAGPRQARRAAWATGLLIAVAAAFAPLTWVLGLAFAAGALAARRWLIAVDPVNVAIVVVTPFFVLFPWSLHLLTSPSAFLSEAGLSTPGLTTQGLSPAALLALSPGGPGVPPVWVTIGLGLALLALVVPVRRAEVVIAGWAVAIAGILAAVLVSRASVTPGGGQPASGWPGVAMALAALGLLLAAAPAAQWLATIISNGGGPLSPAAAAPAAGYGPSRRLLACVALAAAATAPLLVAAYWVKDGVRGPVGSIAAPLLPAFVSASSTSGQQYRTLILRPDGAGLNYLVVRHGDPTLGEPELGTASAAGAALGRQVAALGAPAGADAGDPGRVLGSFGIRWVLLPAPVDPVLAQRLDAALGLAALNKGPSYDLWQVTGTVARVRVVAADGTTTALSSGAVNLSGVTAPASGGTLILAEPYGGWTATLNGHALKPAATPVNGWAQGFVLPPGGGQLSVTRNNFARVASLFLELLATLAICLLALPGKRADPVEEAEALTALREARNGKRAASPTRRAVRVVRTRAVSPTRRVVRVMRTGGAGHRAAGGMDLFAFARKRSGQPRPDPEPVDQGPAAPAATEGETAAAAAARDAELAAPALPEAVTAASLTGWGQEGADWGQERAEPGPDSADSRRDRAAWGQDSRGDDDSSVGSSSAPWDMVGNWDSPSRTGPSDALSADPLEAAKFPEGTVRRDDPFRLTGQQASLPISPVPGSRPPASPILGTPVPESRAQESRAQEGRPPESQAPESREPETLPPWETGLQRAPWESGPQAPVSSTGDQPRYPWESGPQPASRARAQRASRTDEQPAWRIGEPPASRTGSQPASRTQPVSPTWEQPAMPTGTRPGPTAPWESGDWGKAPGWDAIAGSRDVPSVQPEPEPEPGTGSGAWPTTARPAKPEKPEKPERHSHRAAKHGRPSRWRGSGNRSTRDKES